MTMKHILLGGVASVALILTACGKKEETPPVSDTVNVEAAADMADAAVPEITVTDAELVGNPFMADWDTPYGVPPFDQIDDADYLPALKRGVLDLRAEIAAIVENEEEASFENTIIPLELAGQMISKVSGTFGNITNTDTNDTLRELESEVYPMLTREYDAVTFNADLYARVKDVYRKRDRLGLYRS